METDGLSEVIGRLVEVHDRRGGEIAAALNRVADNLRALGSGTKEEKGAIEGLAMIVREGLGDLAAAVEEKGGE